MTDWRAAESIKVLLAEVNAAFPGRDKRTDGVISGYPGSVSSHQINSKGVVCAVDITVGDYANGITPAQAASLAESLRKELKVAPRGIYAYVIYDGRIARSTHDWEWEPYTGSSAHTDHIHVSVDWDIAEGGAPSGACPYDSTSTWNINGKAAGVVATTLPTSRQVTQDWNQDFNWLNGKYYPNGFYASIGWKGHNGIDFGCYEGDPVEAVCDGVIEFAGPGNNHPLLTGGGNAILLRNDALGVRFEYLHLSGFNVTQGQTVKRGQVIAPSGNTGISTAPHLHLGCIPIHNMNVNNGYRGRVDPTPYLYGSLNPDYAGSGAIGPSGTITLTEEDDLVATPEQRKELIDELLDRLVDDGNGGQISIKAALAESRPGRKDIIRVTEGIPAKLLDTRIPRGGGMGGETTLRASLSWHDQHIISIISAVAGAAANDGASVEEIKSAVKSAIKEANLLTADDVVKVDVSVKGAV